MSTAPNPFLPPGPPLPLHEQPCAALAAGRGMLGAIAVFGALITGAVASGLAYAVMPSLRTWVLIAIPLLFMMVGFLLNAVVLAVWARRHGFDEPWRYGFVCSTAALVVIAAGACAAAFAPFDLTQWGSAVMLPAALAGLVGAPAVFASRWTRHPRPAPVPVGPIEQHPNPWAV